MPRSTKSTPPGPEHIVEIDVSEEMRGSFLEYAYSVIYSRALPDARDGLKPVQRRILFQMDQMGLRPDRGHVKSARVVGEVMGRLHPHGDGAIYDALVRMAQPFSLRVPFIDGHGNFGTADDGAAAMRYTEARLARAALAMTDGIDEDVVDFAANYDGRELEPSVLPAAIPSLLVNGATGIAVGMATNMAPHNLGEVIAAARHLIAHPKAHLDELMKFVPGPDLPSGGIIVGLDGIAEAYATGRGAFKIRATARIEQVSPRRKGIVVTELPYNVGPERVIERIKDLVVNKKLQGIADITDLTDGEHGLRLVIEVKNGFNADAILEQLYAMTPLEDSFNINNVALVDGQPKTLGLKELLEVFLAHRFEVIRRRSEFRKRKAEERLHLVAGLLIAILDIDEVIQVIRASDDTAEARERLQTVFDLSEIQANYILEMPLRRLTKFSRIELEAEQDELARTIESLNEILENDASLRRVVSDELAEAANQHGTPRRTILLESTGVTASAASSDLEIADDPCLVLLSATGLLARTSNVDALPSDGPRSKHDVITSVVTSTARGQIGVVTSSGRVLKLNVIDLPVINVAGTAPNLAGGAPIGAILDVSERVLALASLNENHVIALGTKFGVVKRVVPEVLTKDSWDIIKLDEGDEVLGAIELTADASPELVFITSDAQLLHFPASVVRPQGRNAAGMAGIKLGVKARVVYFGAVEPSLPSAVVTVAGSAAALPGTDAGAVKVTSFDQYPGKGRGTQGVRCMRLLKGQDQLNTAWAGAEPIVACTASGVAVDLPQPDTKRDGSGIPMTQPIAGIASTVHRT